MLWAKGLSENEFVLRQRALPVPTPVGRIIIIVIIIIIVEGIVSQHARYYSTGFVKIRINFQLCAEVQS